MQARPTCDGGEARLGPKRILAAEANRSATTNLPSHQMNIKTHAVDSMTAAQEYLRDVPSYFCPAVAFVVVR